MTPLRFTFNAFGSHGHAAGGGDHHCPHPEERLVSGNGPVIVYFENGKKLKVPKVIRQGE